MYEIIAKYLKFHITCRLLTIAQHTNKSLNIFTGRKAHFRHGFDAKPIKTLLFQKVAFFQRPTMRTGPVSLCVTVHLRLWCFSRQQWRCAHLYTSLCTFAALVSVQGEKSPGVELVADREMRESIFYAFLYI